MIHDQADELRHLVRLQALSNARPEAAVPLLVVAGGKGGVGTTTVAANLAIALARQGRRTVFVDADLDHGGNAQFGQGPEQGSVLDVLAGRRGVHEVLHRGPSGVQVLSGAWAASAPAEVSNAAQRRLLADLRNLSPHADVVVVDAGSSRDPFARGLWQAADIVLTVTTPEPVSIMECYAAIKVLIGAALPATVYTLANLSVDPAAAADIQARIAEACRRFLGVQAIALGDVPACPRAVSEPVLIFPPPSGSARALDRVADTLWAQLQLAAGEPGRNTARSA